MGLTGVRFFAGEEGGDESSPDSFSFVAPNAGNRVIPAPLALKPSAFIVIRISPDFKVPPSISRSHSLSSFADLSASFKFQSANSKYLEHVSVSESPL